MDLLERLGELGVVVVLKLDLLDRRDGCREARDEDGPSRQHAEHMGGDELDQLLSVALGGRRMNGRSEKEGERQRREGGRTEHQADGGWALLRNQHL